jgi:hypothetical protein
LRWALNKIPGVVGVEGSTLFFHGPEPVGVGQSISIGAGNGREGLKMECSARLMIPSFASSCHVGELTSGGMGTAPARRDGPCLTYRGGEGMKLERRGGPLVEGSREGPLG